MKKISEKLSKIINIILFLLITVLVGVTFLQVLGRFVFKIPIVWTEELARICFVWLTFIGAAIAVREGTHLNLDMLISQLSGKLAFILHMLILIVTLIVSVILTFAGSNYVIRNTGKTAVTMPIPSNVVYIAAPIAGIIIFWFTVEQIIKCTRSYIGNEVN